MAFSKHRSGGRSHAAARRGAALALGAVLLAAAVPAAGADSARLLAARLPAPNYYLEAAESGGDVYVFGGFEPCCVLGSILKFDPDAGTVTRLGASFPSPRFGLAAEENGDGDVFIFGGFVCGGSCYPSGEIWRYNVATDTLTRMGANLPFGRAFSSVVFDGKDFLLFGGLLNAYGGGHTGEIVRYSPADDAVTVLAAKLPTPRASAPAVWDPTPNPVTGCVKGCAYVLGGDVPGGALTDQIVRVNPTTDEVTVAARLPTPRHSMGVAFDGAFVYALGGGGLRQIVRYDPRLDVVSLPDAALPSPNSHGTSAWAATSDPASECALGCAFVIGGYNGASLVNEIVSYRPDPVPIALQESACSATVGPLCATLPDAHLPA